MPCRAERTRCSCSYHAADFPQNPYAILPPSLATSGIKAYEAWARLVAQRTRLIVDISFIFEADERSKEVPNSQSGGIADRVRSLDPLGVWADVRLC